MASSSDGLVLAGTDPDLPPGPIGEFEKYANFQPMAEGGKATLHAVRDRLIGRTVALKRLKAKYASDPAEQRRFLREARVTAQLAHPNTVPVYEIGRDDAGELYFTMKRIAGLNLFQLLSRIARADEALSRRFPLPRLLEVCADAALALAYAHKHGVVHRDVKPENIWVGDFGEVVLLDWGVAKVWGYHDPADDPGPTDPDAVQKHVDERVAERREMERQTEQLRTLTRTGQLLGTPLYMSPEQVLGHKSLDERSDVFAMGIVLYEVLCMVEPFRGADVRATFDRIIHSTPTPPSERERPDGQTWPPWDAPESVDPIVMRALEKEPEKRWQSMIAMERELRIAANALAAQSDA